MRLTILLFVYLFLFACTTNTNNTTTKVTDKSEQKQKSSVQAFDISLLGDWMYEKIPDSKGATADDQLKLVQVFGDTKLVLTKTDYTISIMGTMDTGTWKKLDPVTLELKSASGRTQKVGIKRLSERQMIFTFLGDKDLQMKKS